MKLVDLFETTYTTATSVGNIEYTTHNKGILLKRRKDSDGHFAIIARIKRESHDGWRFIPTTEWKNQ
jgi:hypothetical protein